MFINKTEAHQSDFTALEPVALKYEWADWKNVIIISSNLFVIKTVRYLLEEIGAIRLTVVHQIPNFDSMVTLPDIIIWARNVNDLFPEIAGGVTVLKRKHPCVKQVIISDMVPERLSGTDKIMPGVYLLNGRVGVSMLRLILVRVFITKRIIGPIFNPVLTSKQWAILCQISAGYSDKDISSYHHVSVKTVYSHRENAMRRLHINNGAAQAWILRNIAIIQREIPAFYRQAMIQGKMG